MSDEPLVIENPKLCGLGQGERTCAFLTMGEGGMLCARSMPEVFNAIVQRHFLFGTMNAKFMPPGDVPYPDCQPGEEGGDPV